jgi:hypothetical protein
MPDALTRAESVRHVITDAFGDAETDASAAVGALSAREHHFRFPAWRLFQRAKTTAIRRFRRANLLIKKPL